MKTREIVSLLSVLLLFAACGRSFESPPPVPPQVSIEAVTPSLVYAGMLLTLEGTNFDADPAKNEVYFGTTLAEVLAYESKEDGEEGQGRLAVRAPLLDKTEAIDLRVVTDQSSVTVEDALRYIGPGHPEDEKLDTVLDARFAAIALSSIPGYTDGMYTLVGGDAWLATWGSDKENYRFDLGTCERPFSSAMVVNGQGLLQTYISTAQFPSDEESDARFSLMRWQTGPSTEIAGIAAPDWLPMPEQVDESIFPPGKLFSFSRPHGPSDPITHDLLVASALHPQALLLHPGNALNPDDTLLGPITFPVDFPDADAYQVRDAVFAEGLGLFFVTVSNQPGIYHFSPNEVDDAAQASLHNILLPTEDGDVALHFSALAWCPLEQRLYAQVAQTGAIFGLAWSESKLEWTLVSASCQSVPFDMVCAKGLDDSGTPLEFLYAVSDAGLEEFFLDSNNRLIRRSGISLPGIRVGSQGLIKLQGKEEEADHIVFADAAQDRIHSMLAGDIVNSKKEKSYGSTMPTLATSSDEAHIYYGDMLANVIRVIDRRNGVQEKQFAVNGVFGFFSYSLQSIITVGGDVLFAPLLLVDDAHRSEKTRYNKLAIWRLDNGADDDSGDHCRAGLQEDPAEAPNTFDTDNYHFTSVGRSMSGTRVFFSRLDEIITAIDDPSDKERIPGSFWYHDLKVNQANLEAMFEEAKYVDINLSPIREDDGTGTLKLLSVSGSGNVVGVLEKDPANSGSLRVYFIDLEKRINLSPPSDKTLVIEVDQTMSSAVGTMVVLREDQETWVADGQGQYSHVGKENAVYTYIVALSAPGLGQVQILSLTPGHPQRRRVVQTGGAPYYLYASPDQKRIYASHLTAGKVSVIELGCDDDPGCAQVSSTLSVDAWPYEIKFAKDGSRAFVTHVNSSRITIIE